MDRSKYFIILVFGVLLGAAVEYMKDVNPTSAKLARMQRLEALMDGGKVVYQPFAKRLALKSKAIHGEVAGLEAAPVAPKTEKTIAPAKKEDDKKKKDAKKKKDDKKKKKKTIKGKGTSAPDSDDSSNDDTDDSAANSPAYSGGPGIAQNGVDPNKLPETVEEWVAFLSPSPDFEKTAKFVKLFQNGALKSDIYYEVVAAMLEDERLKMRELGVMALGSTPSVRSFTMLADFSAIEQGTSAKTQASSYMRMYTRLEYLQHLAGTFNAGSTEATMQALKELELAATIHLKGGGGTGPTEQDTTPRAPASNVQRYFTQVIGPLTELAQSTQNPAVRSTANATLQAIQGS